MPMATGRSIAMRPLRNARHAELKNGAAENSSTGTLRNQAAQLSRRSRSALISPGAAR